MAQTGYSKVQIYSSSTATNTPSAGNLTNDTNGSELAINITDGKLFYKDNSGTVQVLATKGGAFGTVTSVAATVPSFLSISGSPITSSGTLGITLSGTALPTTNGGTGLTSFTANQVFYASSTSAFAQSTNLQFNGTTLTVANDASISGLTVGKGGGAVSTNTAVGASALAVNTTGSRATAVGYSAGTTSNAIQVSYFGYEAGQYATGSFNTAIGDASFSGVNGSSSGQYNVAVGGGALNGDTTGGNNTSVGFQSLYFNTTASNNTAVGYQAGYSNTTGTRNALLGYVAGYSLTGNYCTLIGAGAGYSTTGDRNTFVGDYAGNLITTGTRNTIIGKYDGNTGGLDIRTSSNYIVLSDGDGNPLFFTLNGGGSYLPGVYVDTTASAANMFVRSDGRIQRSTSALKYKQDVRDLEEMDISLLRAVRYKSKCGDDDQNKDHLGLIADEAAEAGFEELVTRGADGEVEGFQYERLTVVLLKKLQVLESEFKAYKEAHP